jgi:hypothetical protein
MATFAQVQTPEKTSYMNLDAMYRVDVNKDGGQLTADIYGLNGERIASLESKPEIDALVKTLDLYVQ